MTHDTYGNPYAKLVDITDGQIVWLDAGFTCRAKGMVQVHFDNDRAYFNCDEGRHYLDGQCDEGEHCIGIYTTNPAASEAS